MKSRLETIKEMYIKRVQHVEIQTGHISESKRHIRHTLCMEFKRKM